MSSCDCGPTNHSPRPGTSTSSAASSWLPRNRTAASESTWSARPTSSISIARMALMPRRLCHPRPRALPAYAVAIVLLAACGSSNATPSATLPVQGHPSPIASLAAGPPAHIAVILMENEGYGGIIGSPSAPYINAVARRYALATGMFAITHPSLPNYSRAHGRLDIRDRQRLHRLLSRRHQHRGPTRARATVVEGVHPGAPDAMTHRARGRRIRQEARPVCLLHADHDKSRLVREHRRAQPAVRRRAQPHAAAVRMDQPQPMRRHA